MTNWKHDQQPLVGVFPTPEVWEQQRRQRIEERFWAKVDRTERGCWTWTGSKTRDGYGVFTIADHRSGMAHRLAYELLVGPIPRGLLIDHLCRNPSCVRPEHLEPVTPKENSRRGISSTLTAARNRLVPLTKTHCPQGHEFTPENSGWQWINRETGAGQRYCRECRRQTNRRCRAEKRAREIARGVRVA